MTGMLTNHEARTLRKFRMRSLNWEPADLPGVGQNTWDRLVTLGFLEERRNEEEGRLLRVTEKGLRAADQARY